MLILRFLEARLTQPWHVVSLPQEGQFRLRQPKKTPDPATMDMQPLGLAYANANIVRDEIGNRAIMKRILPRRLSSRPAYGGADAGLEL